MVIQIFLSCICVLWLFFMYAGLGRFTCNIIGLSIPSRLLKLLVNISIGFGITGNAIMTLCFIQRSYPKWIIAALILFTIVGFLFYRQIIDDLRILTKKSLGILRNSNQYASLLLIVLVGGYAVRGLLPPTGFDALMYHLSTIKLYLQHGGFWNIYFNAQSDFPMLTEMNFMIGLVFNNDIICKTLSFLLALMTLATIAYLCTLYFNTNKIIIPSMLVFCTFTCVIANMSNCDVDIPQALWTVLALISLELYIKEREKWYIVIAAILAGMAVQTKIFGIFAISVLIIRLLIHKKHLIFSPDGIKGVLTLTIIPFLMGLPWYIKSYIYNDTILSISHSSIVGQGLAHPMGIQCTSHFCYWFVNVFLRIFAAPWTFSIFPGQHQSGTFGPLFLAILPFLLFINIPKKIKTLLFMIGIFLAQILFMEIWFIQGGTSIRYSIFILITGAPLIVWTVNQLGNYPKTQKILHIMIICLVCLGSLIFIKRYNKEWVAFLTFQSRDQYYNKILPEYAVISTINKLPKDKVVMPIYNYCDYLINVPYLTACRKYSSPEDMKSDFREKNIGYIFANDKLDTSKNRNTFSELTNKFCIDSTNGFYLFRLSE